MALNIKSAETDRLARELATGSGRSITEAVTRALREGLERQRQDRENLIADLEAISARVAAMPDLDRRSPDELLDYDKDGRWG